MCYIGDEENAEMVRFLNFSLEKDSGVPVQRNGRMIM
jgi:hypothetical protein